MNSAHAARDGAAATVRAVLFDAVGTLIYPRPRVAEAYAQAGRRFGSSLDEAEVARRFRAAFAAAEQEDRLRGNLRTSEPREAARWRRIVAAVFDDVADQQPLFDALWRHFASAANWRLFDDAAAVLAQLSAEGIVWGVASNFDARLHSICQGLPQLTACRHVFVSSELGHRKPARKFFAAIEDALGLEAASIALIGDDLQNDYQAALDAGWLAVLVDRHEQTPAGRRQIADLRQLSKVLGQLA